MTFWSGERLSDVLPNLIEDFSPDRIDCASYRLRLGDEAFVTADKLFEGSPSKPVIQSLSDKPGSRTVRIDPGQFAFLLTLENVTVPRDAIALISMRARWKFRGLINVSGFHVDPGFSGKLLFGVYNAGAAPIVLERGTPLFLIVFADLDRVSDNAYTGSANHRKGIDTDLLSSMTGQVFSPMMLQRRVDELERQDIERSKEIAQLSGTNVGRALMWTALALPVAFVVAMLTTDPAKVLAGMVFKSAITAYEKSAQETVEQMKRGSIRSEGEQNSRPPRNAELPNSETRAGASAREKGDTPLASPTPTVQPPINNLPGKSAAATSGLQQNVEKPHGEASK